MYLSRTIVFLSLGSAIAAPHLPVRQFTSETQKTLDSIDILSADMEGITGLINRLTEGANCNVPGETLVSLARQGGEFGEDFLLQEAVILISTDQFASKNKILDESLNTNSIVDAFEGVENSSGSSDLIFKLATRWLVHCF